MVSFSQGVAKNFVTGRLETAMESRISVQVEENTVRSSSGARSRAYIGEALKT